ncbi:unnamed protein product [Linum tenue]|uniref:Uncharacterized protein n=1 Tax=Linum tenue TaxID=586396 RepID=A0AAV0KKL2_9ROSI|nr:unnamed protein product [Linum tenue]
MDDALHLVLYQELIFILSHLSMLNIYTACHTALALRSIQILNWVISQEFIQVDKWTFISQQELQVEITLISNHHVVKIVKLNHLTNPTSLAAATPSKTTGLHFLRLSTM